ncbi:MAG: hypothetical protein H6562_23135 [Lewinellaceae bacterium]|nr:hypothetical protein [Lewinellaceae bacterium]
MLLLFAPPAEASAKAGLLLFVVAPPAEASAKAGLLLLKSVTTTINHYKPPSTIINHHQPSTSEQPL